MEKDAILLKIKREFTTNEAVQTVLKEMAALEKEIGMLKSELAEAEYKVEKIRTEKSSQKKNGWNRKCLNISIKKTTI